MSKGESGEGAAGVWVGGSASKSEEDEDSGHIQL